MTPCIEWNGKLDRNGYGAISIRRPGENWKRQSVHRLAFEWANGRPGIPMVLHRCHNRKCWNPEHLYEGDNAQNMRDRAESGRNRSGQDKYRHLIVRIRELCRSGHKQRAVAKLLGVPKSVVGDIMSGACWSDVV